MVTNTIQMWHRNLPWQSLGVWFKFRTLTFQYMLKDRRPRQRLATAPRPWREVEIRVAPQTSINQFHATCVTCASSSTSWQPSRFRHSNAGSDGSAFSVVLVTERQKDASISRMLAPARENSWHPYTSAQGKIPWPRSTMSIHLQKISGLPTTLWVPVPSFQDIYGYNVHIGPCLGPSKGDLQAIAAPGFFVGGISFLSPRLKKTKGDFCFTS